MRFVVAMLALAVSLPALAEDSRVQQAYPAEYIDECGSCHDLFQPDMLTKADWTLVMTGLEKHWGSDAGIDNAKTRSAIAEWLARNAGGGPQRFAGARLAEREGVRAWTDELKRSGSEALAYCSGCPQGAAQEESREND